MSEPGTSAFVGQVTGKHPESQHRSGPQGLFPAGAARGHCYFLPMPSPSYCQLQVPGPLAQWWYSLPRLIYYVSLKKPSAISHSSDVAFSLFS